MFLICQQQDSFVVRLYNPAVSPMSVVSELPLKLTRKCMDVFGSAGYDPETEKRSISKLGFQKTFSSNFRSCMIIVLGFTGCIFCENLFKY